MGIPDGCLIAPIGLPTTLNATDASSSGRRSGDLCEFAMPIRDAPKNGLSTGELAAFDEDIDAGSSWRPTAVTATRAPSVMNAWHRSKPAFFVGMSTNCKPRKHALTTWPG